MTTGGFETADLKILLRRNKADLLEDMMMER